MHKKYGAEGFVAVSISLDNPEEADTRAKVNAFLQKKEAAGMINLMAAGDTDDWYKDLKAAELPLVYVFDRENRRVHKLVGGEKVDYKVIESEVAKLLKK